MTRIITLVLTCIFLSSVVNGWLFKKKNWPVKAVGKITCNGMPMPFVYIKLMDKDLFFHDTMATTRSNANGQFSVSGSGRDGLRGKPDPFIRVHYSYSGYYGRMKIVNWINIVRKGQTKARGYSSNINFGTINFSSIHCEAYVQFYKAIKDYKTRSLNNLPYKTLYVKTKALIHGGAAYATTNTIRIPKTYKEITFRTARHELAHTVRHSLDGTFPHFLNDVIRYKYAQHHRCSTKTNYGFAFNEGWAEFWSQDCKGNYGNSLDFTVEGNVAKRLRYLKSKCKSSDWKMDRVLRRNRGRIHSFQQYNNRHYRLYHCKV